MPTKTPAKKSTTGKTSTSKVKDKETPFYFSVPEFYASFENSQVVIIPCAYEATTTQGKGTKFGPQAVFEASKSIELFDDELWTESYKIGIHTHKELKIAPVVGETQNPFHEIHDAVKQIVEITKFPILVGGEHAITVGAVRACAERYPDLSVLQISAHSDCRRSHEGNPYSHRSTSYQIYKKALPQPRITQVGVRNISSEEVTWMEKEKPNINIYWARQQDRWNFQDIVSTLSDNVYLDIDVSALDCSVMPSTGRPEPGGMHWYQLIDLIKVLCIKKNVIGANIVELSPIKGLTSPDLLCAKLLYKIIGYRFALDLGVTKKY